MRKIRGLNDSLANKHAVVLINFIDKTFSNFVFFLLCQKIDIYKFLEIG